MYYVFTIETVWKFQICRISGCQYKSGNGFNGEKVRVKGTNRKQARVQERGPGPPTGEPEDHVLWGVTTHRSQPAALRMLWGHVSACVCVDTCMCARAEKEAEKGKGEGVGEGITSHWKCFLVLKTFLVGLVFVNIPVCPIFSSSRNIGACSFSESYLAFF